MFEHTALEAEMTKAILARAKRKILLADSTKWERPSIIRFAHWKEIDDWITDKPRTAKEARKLRSFGLNLHVSRRGRQARVSGQQPVGKLDSADRSR